MKNLLHNISILAMLALLVAGIQSCSDDLQETGDVEVSFTATLPTDTRTRSFGKAEQVNTLVVGIFNERNTEIGRKEFAITGTTINVSLSLAQNQTYRFVFWAYDSSQNIYDIDDLTAIRMVMKKDENNNPLPVTFGYMESLDAFFATQKDITVTGSSNYSIKLVRPLAQINVGTTGTPIQASLRQRILPTHSIRLPIP